MLNLANQIKKDEGLRYIVYLDSKNNPTVGWGHWDPSLIVGTRYGIEQIKIWFQQDLESAIKDYHSLKLQLDPLRQDIVTMIIFQLGLPTFRQFKNTLRALRDKNFPEAARQLGIGTGELIPSQYRIDTSNRVHRYMAAILTGVWV